MAEDSIFLDGIVLNSGLPKQAIVLICDLELSVSDGIESVEINDGHNIAKYDTISGKPLIRSVGSDVRTVSVKLNLINTFGLNVKDRITDIKNIQGVIGLFLLVGNGIVFKVCVTSVKESIVKMSGNVITQALIQIEATEYDERNILEVIQIDKKKLTPVHKKQRKYKPVVKEEVKQAEVEQQYKFKLQKVTLEADSTRVDHGIIQ